MTGRRRKARTFAFQALYEIDLVKHGVEAVVTHLLADEELSEEEAAFVRRLVGGVVQNRGKIDQHIQKFASAWPLEQISVVDRNILRLAIFEILVDNETPVKVVINEAVELAKRYGSDNSSRFVNGVLGSVSTLVQQTERIEDD